MSIVGVVLIAWGFGRYRATGWIDVWYPPLWTRHVTVSAGVDRVDLRVAAYSPGRIKVTLKHPMLVGVKIWAAAHLMANGDLGSIILFGSILGWAVFDRISLKRRTDPGGPPIPVGGFRQDMIAIVGGTILYLLLGFVFHPFVVGVPAFGTPALLTVNGRAAAALPCARHIASLPPACVGWVRGPAETAFSPGRRALKCLTFSRKSMRK